MRRPLTTLSLITLTVALLSGCVAENQRDLEGVNGRDPDKVEVYRNIDEHPNVVRMCIDGVALMTTSRENGQNLLRVPEWDVTFCGAVK